MNHLTAQLTSESKFFIIPIITNLISNAQKGSLPYTTERMARASTGSVPVTEDDLFLQLKTLSSTNL